MAILSKIRERSLFLIIIIGLALFAFVLDPSTLSDFFNSSKVNELGSVNGETISRQEFAKQLEKYKQQAGGEVSEMQAAKSVWSGMLRNKVYESQLSEAGITIGEADIMKALYQSSFIQQDPRFSDQGVFNKNKLKSHLASIRADGADEWKAWQGYMAALKEDLQRSTYDNLVSAGLTSSLQEGKAQYFYENANVSGNLVFVPFTSVPNTEVEITKSEVKSYIEAHSKEYQVEASRDINYVKYDIIASAEDEKEIKASVAKLINDENNAGVVIPGLKNTTDYVTFFSENEADIPFNESATYKATANQPIAKELFEGSKGDVFGPYKERGYFKISKITEILQLPDSVKASHILIPFAGSNAGAKTTKTEEQAKVTADSVLAIVKADKSRFAGLAKELSADKSNSEKAGELSWFTYNRMVPSFRDYCFENRTGDIGVIKTQFGFHIVKIDEQKNYQEAVKLVTFSKIIEASEATENVIYEEAESLAQALSSGGSFPNLVKEKSLKSSPAIGIKALDESVPGIGKERQIVTWAFEKDLPVGSYKRFDVDGGYVVATLKNKIEKGLMPVDKAITSVRPILIKEKKAKILSEKFSGTTLADIATATGEETKEFSGVNMQAPTISGVGFDAKLAGAMINAKENKVYQPVIGDRGVYAFEVNKKVLPKDLPNYDTYKKRLSNEKKVLTYKIYDAIKGASEVDDNLSNFYGIQ